MIFVRDVDKEKIQDTYRESLKENASVNDLKAVQPIIDQFIGYFSKDVKENDQFILRWLPGGKVIAIIQGEEKPAITNEVFARALWSIWFGKDAVVDRDDLVERIVSE